MARAADALLKTAVTDRPLNLICPCCLGPQAERGIVRYGMSMGARAAMHGVRSDARDESANGESWSASGVHGERPLGVPDGGGERYPGGTASRVESKRGRRSTASRGLLRGSWEWTAHKMPCGSPSASRHHCRLCNRPSHLC